MRPCSTFSSGIRQRCKQSKRKDGEMMMNLWKGAARRVGATLLACVLLLGLLPQLTDRAGAAYTDSYLQQMVDWGFMRGDI